MNFRERHFLTSFSMWLSGKRLLTFLRVVSGSIVLSLNVGAFGVRFWDPCSELLSFVILLTLSSLFVCWFGSRRSFPQCRFSVIFTFFDFNFLCFFKM